MRLLGVLPVKNLDKSKSRLSLLLSQKERIQFVLTLIRRTIKIFKSSKYIEDVLLISQDKRIQAISAEDAVFYLKDKGEGLNQALEQASIWSSHRGYGANLFLPLDLPMLTKKDIDNIASLGVKKERVIVIAPDNHYKGTNALLIKPPGVLRYQFEGKSFFRHIEQARNRGIPFEIYCSSSIGLDVDIPSDFCSIKTLRFGKAFHGRI